MNPIPSDIQIQDFFPPAMFAQPGQTYEEAENELHRAVDSFKAWLSDMGETLHAPVAPGRWSPAEYADHLVKTNRFMTRLLERADAGEYLPDLEKGSLREGVPMSAQAIWPQPGRALTALLEDVDSSVAALLVAAKRLHSVRPSDTCIPNWFFGRLRPLEVVQHTVMHFGRHTPQL